jgi:hypothetical protein
MRFSFSIFFLLLSVLINGQGRIELALLTTPQHDQKLVDSLFKELLRTNNPKAVLFWAEHLDVQNDLTNKALWMTNETPTFIVDTISQDYSGWSTLLKSIKKPKQKALALDSLLSLSPQSNEERIDRIRALTELKFLLVKKRKSLIEECQILPPEIKSSAYDELRYRSALASLFRSWKATTELKANEVAIEFLRLQFDKNFMDYLHQTMTYIGTELSEKKQEQTVLQEPISKENSATVYYVIIGVLAVLAAVLGILMLVNYKRSKSNSLDAQEFAELERQWKEKEQLYNEQFDDLKNKIKELNAGNDKLKTEFTHLNSVVNETKEQIENLQTTTKEHLEELIKEPGVSQVMNLKNGITRGLMKLKETLGR